MGTLTTRVGLGNDRISRHRQTVRRPSTHTHSTMRMYLCFEMWSLPRPTGRLYVDMRSLRLCFEIRSLPRPIALTYTWQCDHCLGHAPLSCLRSLGCKTHLLFSFCFHTLLPLTHKDAFDSHSFAGLPLKASGVFLFHRGPTNAPYLDGYLLLNGAG